MSTYRKYYAYLIGLIIMISLGANLYFIVELGSLKRSVSSSNTIISSRVESGIRDTMHSVKAFKDTGSKDDLINLQRSVQQLVVIYNNWIDLNQTKDKPNEALMRGLGGLESLRNTVVHNLHNQYSSHNEKMTDYDIELLENIDKELEKFLTIYSNIEGRLHEIKKSDKGDGGLSQWASNMEEITRLYRHSRIPNKHPNYIDSDTILTEVDKNFSELVSFREYRKVADKVQIKDGVHYYEISYHMDGELSYLIWIDAMDGSLRKFEDSTKNSSDVLISKDEALNVAKGFMNRFEKYDNIIEAVSLITEENTEDTIYAFQFIPVSGEITMISDRVQVNVSSRGGRVIKYSSDFGGTKVPISKVIVSLEDIEEKYSEQLLDMRYTGMSIVRSFYTYYMPVVTYSYQSTKNEENRRLYFDISTGNQVYESFSVYEPLSYIDTDENYY